MRQEVKLPDRVQEEIDLIDRNAAVYDYQVGNGEIIIYAVLPNHKQYCVTYAELD